MMPDPIKRPMADRRPVSRGELITILHTVLIEQYERYNHGGDLWDFIEQVIRRLMKESER